MFDSGAADYWLNEKDIPPLTKIWPHTRKLGCAGSFLDASAFVYLGCGETEDIATVIVDELGDGGWGDNAPGGGDGGHSTTTEEPSSTKEASSTKESSTTEEP